MASLRALSLSLFLSLAVLPALIAAAEEVMRDDGAGSLELSDVQVQTAPRIRKLRKLMQIREAKPGFCQGQRSNCQAAGFPDCCRNKCTNKSTDPNNCGRCGKVCKNGWKCCSGKCKNIKKDWENCGDCGTVCPAPPCTSKTVGGNNANRRIGGRRNTCIEPTCVFGLCSTRYGTGRNLREEEDPRLSGRFE